MPTLTQVSVFSGDLEAAVKRYDSGFRELKMGLGNTVKYGLYREFPESNLIMVSKQIHEIIGPDGYNFIITISSDKTPLNQAIARDFQERTGVRLREAPAWLTSNCNVIDLTFQVFKRRGSSVMDALA